MDEKYDIRPMANARELMELLRRSNKEWLEDGSKKSNRIFRGQPNADYNLVPSAWRESASIKNILKNVISEMESADLIGKLDEKIRKRAQQIDPKHADRISSYVWQIVCELYLADDFNRRSNNVGLRVSKVNPFDFVASPVFFSFFQDEILYGDTYRRKEEEQLREQAIKSMINQQGDINLFSLRNLYNNNFPTFALAQHHGIPTRFLDWTRNPLKAAYFAADGIDSGVEEIAVFALDSLHLSSYGISVLDEFPHADFQFLHVQEGVFTYFENANGWFLKYGSWPTIESVLSDDGCTGLLRLLPKSSQRHPRPIKITLAVEEVDELKRLLEAEGITQESLMPTYNHVAEAMKKRLDRD